MTLDEPITNEQYEFIRKLVYDQSRINLGEGKQELVRSRLRKRLAALGMPSFDDYCQLLETDEGRDEITDLLDVVSTNVTEFFREWKHFELMQKTVLPQWERASRRNPGEPFQVWSAACSSGEEPYSLAILLANYFRGPDLQSRSWRVLATDISTRMLSKARQGIYPSARVKLPDDSWLPAYFKKGVDDWEGYYRVKPELRERVKFDRVNFFEWPYPFTDKFQAIFCRNVMIYFDHATQEQLVPRLAQHLAPGGFLFVGHSESLTGINHGLKCVQPSAYQRL